MTNLATLLAITSTYLVTIQWTHPDSTLVTQGWRLRTTYADTVTNTPIPGTDITQVGPNHWSYTTDVAHGTGVEVAACNTVGCARSNTLYYSANAKTPLSCADLEVNGDGLIGWREFVALYLNPSIERFSALRFWWASRCGPLGAGGGSAP